MQYFRSHFRIAVIVLVALSIASCNAPTAPAPTHAQPTAEAVQPSEQVIPTITLEQPLTRTEQPSEPTQTTVPTETINPNLTSIAPLTPIAPATSTNDPTAGEVNCTPPYVLITLPKDEITLYRDEAITDDFGEIAGNSDVCGVYKQTNQTVYIAVPTYYGYIFAWVSHPEIIAPEGLQTAPAGTTAQYVATHGGPITGNVISGRGGYNCSNLSQQTILVIPENTEVEIVRIVSGTWLEVKGRSLSTDGTATPADLSFCVSWESMLYKDEYLRQDFTFLSEALATIPK